MTNSDIERATIINATFHEAAAAVFDPTKSDDQKRELVERVGMLTALDVAIATDETVQLNTEVKSSNIDYGEDN